LAGLNIKKGELGVKEFCAKAHGLGACCFNVLSDERDCELFGDSIYYGKRDDSKANGRQILIFFGKGLANEFHLFDRFCHLHDV
jgi:hypothetical protein